MSDASGPPARRPGLIGLGVGVLLLSVFVYKLARWYHAVATGAEPIAAMTGGQWFRVAFYHLAVVAGVAGLIGMLRERARANDS